MNKGLSGFLAALLLGCCTAASASPAEVPLVPSVDLPRFMGDWYVIAHIPPSIDRDAHNAVESYALEDGIVSTTYRRRPGGFEAPEKISRPAGHVQAGTGNALWAMRFVRWLPLGLEFRISHLEPDYSVTIIGRSRRDFVWLMSRSPVMPEADYIRYSALIASWGYDPAKLIRVPQHWPGSGPGTDAAAPAKP